MQEERKGTADALLAAREALEAHKGDVLVLYADTPLLTPETLTRLLERLDDAHLAVLGFKAADPTGYGRLIIDKDDWLTAIREENDATDAERRLRLCNSGVMAFRVDDLVALLDRIGNANAKGEFYLTDAVAIAREAGPHAPPSSCCEEDEVLGVNARDQLAAAEAIFQRARALSGHARWRDADRPGDGLVLPTTPRSAATS